LRNEIGQFLVAVRNDGNEKRSDERIPGSARW
jgi:hypothetical protein